MGVAENFNVSLLGENKTEDTFDGRGFSCSVRTEIAEDLTLLYRQRNTSEDFLFFEKKAQLKGFVKVLYLEYRGHGFLPYYTEIPFYFKFRTPLIGQDMLDSIRIDSNVKVASKIKIKSLLRLVDLEDSADLQLRKFSRGMLQRIGMAQALLNDPSLVFLDEPLGGLDPLGRKEIRDIITRLKDEGKTVFLSSHILQDIEMICNRVAIIVNGEIINQGALHDLISEKILFTEVILSGVNEKELKELGECLSGHGDRTLLKVFKEENVEKVLQLAQSSKGKVHSLIPRTETLEDLFVGIVKQR